MEITCFFFFFIRLVNTSSRKRGVNTACVRLRRGRRTHICRRRHFDEAAGEGCEGGFGFGAGSRRRTTALRPRAVAAVAGGGKTGAGDRIPGNDKLCARGVPRRSGLLYIIMVYLLPPRPRRRRARVAAAAVEGMMFTTAPEHNRSHGNAPSRRTTVAGGSDVAGGVKGVRLDARPHVFFPEFLRRRPCGAAHTVAARRVGGWIPGFYTCTYLFFKYIRTYALCIPDLFGRVFGRAVVGGCLMFGQRRFRPGFEINTTRYRARSRGRRHRRPVVPKVEKPAKNHVETKKNLSSTNKYKEINLNLK